MPVDISPYLAEQIDRVHQAAVRVRATAPALHQAKIEYVLRELEALPMTVAESSLLLAVSVLDNRLRAIERDVQRDPAPASSPWIPQNF